MKGASDGRLRPRVLDPAEAGLLLHSREAGGRQSLEHADGQLAGADRFSTFQRSEHLIAAESRQSLSRVDLRPASFDTLSAER
jgi:hypothetical protein